MRCGDYVRMAEQLANIQRQLSLSLNATPFVRETLTAFEIEEIATTWQLSAERNGMKVNELLISNRPG